MRGFRLNKTPIFFILLFLLLGLGLLILTNDRFLIQSGLAAQAETFTPREDVRPWRKPQFNEDYSLLYYYNVARIEEVQEKNFLFRKYVTMIFRPKGGQDFADHTYRIDIPADMVSTGTFKLRPAELKNYQGKLMGFNVLYDDGRADKYNFFNVKGWEILNII